MRSVVVQLRMNIVQYGRLVDLPAPGMPSYEQQRVGIQLYTGFHLKPKVGKLCVQNKVPFISFPKAMEFIR